MLIDTHIHIGQFYNHYFAPLDLRNLMEQIQVRYYAVSSTSICEENYKKVLDELNMLIDLDGDKVLPVMWITPMGLQGNIAWLLESEIQWKMLKIHPFLNSEIWLNNPSLYTEVTDIAREMKLPVLIHTGNEDCCQSFNFESIIAENPDINFILAHGRPYWQAMTLSRKYKNAYVDSAFMPIEHMGYFINDGNYSKLLWGTDMCIPKHFYPNQDMTCYYHNKLEAFRKICTQNQFDHVTWLNAVNLFNLQDRQQ